MNKKAGSKYLSIWWFFVLIVVAVGIVGGVIGFYGNPLDVNTVEAKILNDKLFDCILDKGIMRTEILNDKILENCNIKISEDYWVYVYVKGENVFEKGFGRASFQEECDMGNKYLKSRYYPDCFERKLILGDYEIKIKTGSNYHE